MAIDGVTGESSPLPFSRFTAVRDAPSALRSAITAATRIGEPEALQPLLDEARLTPDVRARVQALATRLATRLRERRSSPDRAGLVQGLLQEFSLSSQEGVALMCLAEALLRIPDAATRDALIRDKLGDGDWHAHVGRSRSLFVNAAAWGLLFTGKLVSTHSERRLGAALGGLIRRGGEPLIRHGVDLAMRMMGEQFVTGETIEQALLNARTRESQGFRYSYDMLGEAALTQHDASRYAAAYERAIHAIGAASAGRGIHEGPGISIKLSALHPRYVRSQYGRVTNELYPVLERLAALARGYDIGLNIDAEEAERLELSLDLLERLCFEPSLSGWDGIGFVIQAYQKRCPMVVDFLIDLARRSGHRLMVRLVKGAYWDSEIKRAQIDGLDGYPVYTRKPHTDVCYLACARRLLAAPDAIYPQLATHNAQTLSAIYHLAGPGQFVPGQYEFQCLHGMGEPLYEQVVGDGASGTLGRPCRIYAPVGTHKTLLAYLVRRLLENGANTSFVHRIADDAVPISTLVQDPVQAVEAFATSEGSVGSPHPAIALPRDLYGASRPNSRGLDLANEQVLTALAAGLRASVAVAWTAEPIVAKPVHASAVSGGAQAVRNPADGDDVVGQVIDSTPAHVDTALEAAEACGPAWAATVPAARAQVLRRAADVLESDRERLTGLMIREAGKSCSNAIAEIREAVDFLRFYAARCEHDLEPGDPPLGPVVCISPWNFPLSIFVGQVAAALAAGNSVLAKPAEQTPLVAAQAVRILLESGVPDGVLQFLPGRGETVGASLVADRRTMGVLFTGSTDVARILNKTLADRLDPRGRPIPLVAETGGQNAMIVDSSALAEQVVTDVVTSAFDSAGQRCSALRVLCLQQDSAEAILDMLRGAMVELRVGNPDELATDVGPVIDAEAVSSLRAHVDSLRAKGRRVYQLRLGESPWLERGCYFPPTVIELERLGELESEVFGPVLHVLRYRRDELPALIEQINATGYGLTLGLHTRIDETIERIVAAAHAGNIYVNRNMVGAVVGVQPFGGEGLSGTGPKAGGPLYLRRLCAVRREDEMTRIFDGTEEAGGGQPQAPAQARSARQVFAQWAGAAGRDALAAACVRFADASRVGRQLALPGPTGEQNLYTLVPRRAILCLADDESDMLLQLAAVLAVGSRAVWPRAWQPLFDKLPPPVQQHVVLAPDWKAPSLQVDAVLHHGTVDDLRRVQHAIAERPGPIVGITALRPGETKLPLERLLVERSLSVNTAAAGGNATLMSLG